jgi:glycosyltransferase involved in cell wall biosynthesis
MKILIINSRYGYVGGPERYLFNLKELLEQKGHQVIPFSIKYSINEPSEFDEYFASPLSDDESVYFKEQQQSLSSVVKTLERNFYSNEVEARLTRLIDATKPDYAVVMLYLRKLSPSVLVALHKRKVPFAVRLSDFGMICSSHNFFRNDAICEKCLNGSKLNSVLYKCVHDSYLASFVNYTASKFHNLKGYFDLIPQFLCPSQFLIEKMVSAGWRRELFYHLPTLVPPQDTKNIKKNEFQILYSGRIEHIKGVHHLLEAFKIIKHQFQLPATLILAGNDNPSYRQELTGIISDNNLSDIYFKGNLKIEQLQDLYKSSVISVVPSLVYDNMPNSALESMAAGTPVFAPNQGSFPEIIKSEITGSLYEAGNFIDLAEKLKNFLLDNEKQKLFSNNSLKLIRENHSPESHYSKLMNIPNLANIS